MSHYAGFVMMYSCQFDPRLFEISDCLYRVAVKAIIIKDGKLLLVKEDDDEFWSLPGGGCRLR